MASGNKGKCQVCPKFSDSRCSWCKLIFYCSKEHQKQDWPHHKETCTKKKYRMEDNKQLGSHLVATEDIKPDHILFKDKPLVLSYKLDTLEYTGNKICLGCYKEISLVQKPARSGKLLSEKNENYNNKRRQERNRGERNHERKAKIKRGGDLATASAAPSTSSSPSLLPQEKVLEVDKEQRKQIDNDEEVKGGKKVQSGSNENDDEQKENDDESCDHHHCHHPRNNNDAKFSPQNAQEEEKKAAEDDDNESEEEYDGADDDNADDDENDESDEYDNSNDEDNDDDDDDDDLEEEKVCLSCHLPICSLACSAQYFHKNFECKLLREAMAAYQSKFEQQQLHQQQQQQQNLELSSNAVLEQPGENSGKREQQGKKVVAAAAAAAAPFEVVTPSSTSCTVSEENSNSSNDSNQESMSPGTTCINKPDSRCNTSSTATATATTNNTMMMMTTTPPNIITSRTNRRGRAWDGIREALLRNLLYFRILLLKHVNEGHWNQLISLQSNEESRRSDVAGLEKTARIFTLIKKTLAEINHPTWSHVYKPDVHKLVVGIVEINALHISISQNVEVSGIFPTFSLMEHSCIPSVKYYLVPTTSSALSSSPSSLGAEADKENNNASASTSNHSKKRAKTSTFFELYCRSAIKLKQGDHLTVMKGGNAMWNTEKRREFLQKEKNLWCECARCEDSFELGSNFSTILCPLQDCKAPSVPVRKANSAEILWKCTRTTCGKTCAAWQVKKVDTKLCEMVGRAKSSIDSYKNCLAKMQELVHPDYYLCCIVTHSLIQMYGHDSDSVHNKELLEEKISLCNKLIGAFKKLDPGLATLNIYAGVVYMEMHSAILASISAEVDDDWKILRNNKETVNLAKLYLQKCIDCFKYDFLELPENKLKVLAMKKMEYLNLVMNRR